MGCGASTEHGNTASATASKPLSNHIEPLAQHPAPINKSRNDSSPVNTTIAAAAGGASGAAVGASGEIVVTRYKASNGDSAIVSNEDITHGDDKDNKDKDDEASNVSTLAGFLGSALGGSTSLSNVADLMGKVNALVADQASGPLVAFAESFADIEAIVRTVANLVVPPPGGQVVAAAVAIAAMMIKGAANVKQCCMLATDMNRLLVQVLQPDNRKALEQTSSATRAAASEFLEVCSDIHNFVESVLKQGWVKRLITWKETADEIQAMQNKLTKVNEGLMTSATLAQLSIANGIKEEAEKLKKVIEASGGAENLINDKDGMKKLISVTEGTTDAVMLSFLRDMKENQSMIMRSMMDHVTDEGPHTMIGNVKMKNIWKGRFAGKESVKWDDFFTVFPSQSAQYLSAEEMLLLMEELPPAGEARLKFKAACDVEDDEYFSVSEITQSFPPEADLVEQVRKLKGSPAKKGIAKMLPEIPAELFGREAEIQKLVETLGQARVVLVSAGPGEGKQSIAAKALDMMYEDGKAYGGVWSCNLAGVESADEISIRFIKSLSKNPKPFEQSSCGIDAALTSRLAELEKMGSPLYILIHGMEELIVIKEAEDGDKNASSALLRDQLQATIVKALHQVRNIHFVLVSRVDALGFTDIEKFLGREGSKKPQIPVIKLKKLDSKTEGVSIVQSHCPDISPKDAESLADYFDCNPLMLEIMATALRDGRMAIHEVTNMRNGMAGVNIVNMAASDYVLETNMVKIVESVQRTLRTLSADQRATLLKLSVLVPGSFNKETLRQILDIHPRIGDTLLKRLTSFKLLQQEPGSEDAFKVTPLVKQASLKILNDKTGSPSAKRSLCRTSTIKDGEMALAWRKYVIYCLTLAKKDFANFKTTPRMSFSSILKNKGNVQQALKVAVDPEEDIQYVAKDCLQELMEIMTYIPYFGSRIYDGELIEKACYAISEVASGEGAAASRGLCLAVRAFFLPDITPSDQEAVIQAVEEALDVLADVSSDKPALAKAMALRRKGVVQRDMGHYDDSVEALMAARLVMESSNLLENKESQLQAKLELILVLAELAGTLDYQGKTEEGGPIADLAVSKAREYYGKDKSHPVTALCLTTEGYYLKAKGLFSEAKAVHREAYDMRVEVFGKSHLDVAVSLQQMAISMIELGEYDKAKTSLMESLSIRQDALGLKHAFIFNTYRQLADLHLKLELTEDAESYLRKCKEVGDSLEWSRTHKKKLAAIKDLIKILKAKGAAEEATALEGEFGL
ncbi:hypothetical protein CEUSTIGMA_g4007.t1 [Chlamydomonas eustigma]|uniref:MalT-like TPR region domain-containing protein n=1 Tax=Chlamydomonas eustigma TaxID=1157962 RepID=A0A250X0G1_9CHLO|nr:hypothetical protein CEUSTIGMA_g4007.t1 [Chlamydomonas eustigma]|eukprot:GAX76561.1 hypothetical protein CEUSTIGMA_g4007.t1 [Chlamydomonas eustigma]